MKSVNFKSVIFALIAAVAYMVIQSMFPGAATVIMILLGIATGLVMLYTAFISLALGFLNDKLDELGESFLLDKSTMGEDKAEKMKNMIRDRDLAKDMFAVAGFSLIAFAACFAFPVNFSWMAVFISTATFIEFYRTQTYIVDNYKTIVEEGV